MLNARISVLAYSGRLHEDVRVKKGEKYTFLDCTIDDIMGIVSFQNNEDSKGDASKNI
jgi:hypothetical protein